MATITFRVGQVKGLAHIDARINAQISRGIAERTLARVKKRVPHPAAQTLRVVGVNQYVADITGPRGGPGIVVPVRAKALRFIGRQGLTFAKAVDGAGLLPLIVAEAERVTNQEAGAIVRSIKI